MHRSISNCLLERETYDDMLTLRVHGIKGHEGPLIEAWGYRSKGLTTREEDFSSDAPDWMTFSARLIDTNNDGCKLWRCKARLLSENFSGTNRTNRYG